MPLPFETLIDTSFVDLAPDKSLGPVANKWLLSLANDFEDRKWRYEKFQNFIWDNIAETALSSRERRALIDQPLSLLTEAAKKLRLLDKDDKGRGSELAEVILYGIMKHHFNALSVVPKIFYKQNSRDYAKGSDSVHIVVSGKDHFTLWFGEAKFFKKLDEVSLGQVLDSVESSLKTDKLKKENSIITNVSDLDNLGIESETVARIRESISHVESIDSIKPVLNIPILLLYQCEITNGVTEITDEYRAALRAHHIERANAYFKKQIGALGAKVNMYSLIRFHLILFPVPDKKDTVDAFMKLVSSLREKGV